MTEKSLTEWALALAMTHDLEVRAGNEGEVGPTRGLSLYVRGLEAGRIFRIDPEHRPHRLVSFLPELRPLLEPEGGVLLDVDAGFMPGPEDPVYRTIAWVGEDRAPLRALLEKIITVTQQHAVPSLGDLP